MEDKIKKFAELLEKQQIERLQKCDMDCPDNIRNARVTIKAGKKYTKVDIGRSGKYMVDNKDGNIFGIKAYGQIHKRHWYGNLDSIDLFYWGNYTAYRIDLNIKKININLLGSL